MNEKVRIGQKVKQQPLTKRKYQSKIERKTGYKNQNRHTKFSGRKYEVQQAENKNYRNRIQENQSILQANVSVIEGTSFNSNKQDHSLDSMDKMIIGVSDEKQSEEESKFSAAHDIDYTAIHKEYELLIGREEILGDDLEREFSDQNFQSQDNRVLPEQESDLWVQNQEEKPQIDKDEKLRVYSPTKKNQLKKRLAKIESKMEEIKYSNRRHQDISTSSIKNLNMGNLSAIHEERENQYNQDGNKRQNVHITNEEDEEDLIDFVIHSDHQNNKQNNNHNNIFTGGQTEQGVEVWQDESPMLANLELQLQKDNKFTNKNNDKSRNYQPLLEELNSKQQEVEKVKCINIEQIIEKRQKWVVNMKGRSNSWKNRQLEFLKKLQHVIKNPFYDSGQSESSDDIL